jgi:hypothetical protein
VEAFVCGGGFTNSIKEYLHRFILILSTKYGLVEVVEIVEVVSLLLGVIFFLQS